MQRRKILKTIAAGGALSLAASSSVNAVKVSVEEIGGVELLRDEEVIKQVENPTEEEFKRLEAMLGGDGITLRMEEDCSTYCVRDCSDVCDGTCYYTHDCSDTEWCC